MLEDRLSSDYKQAMKDRDPLRVSTLSFLRAQLKYAAIDKKVEKLEDPDVVTVIKKQVKQRQDSIEQYEKGGRAELADKEKKELAILKGYLPQELSAEEIKTLIAEAVRETGASSMKDMGQIMKVLMPKVAGRADNKILSDLVRQSLS